jgi:hypothetical protein
LFAPDSVVLSDSGGDVTLNATVWMDLIKKIEFNSLKALGSMCTSACSKQLMISNIESHDEQKQKKKKEEK